MCTGYCIRVCTAKLKHTPYSETSAALGSEWMGSALWLPVNLQTEAYKTQFTILQLSKDTVSECVHCVHLEKEGAGKLHIY